MIHDLKPYPEYKDSGVPWLGEVPEHWEVKRQRNIAQMLVSNIDKHSLENEKSVRLCNYVDVYKNERITEDISFMRATASKEEIEKFRLRVGDVIITKDSEMWNDIGVPALVEYEAPDLVCGYHLAILRPRDCVMIGAYFLRALQSQGIESQYYVSANGVTRYGLSHDAIKSVLVPVPPLPEQSAIFHYLDYIDNRIRRYIRAKQKLIKLLEEQKKAIIHQVVTRGLDPNVKLKPSGVEWLGDVPEHWQITRLSRLTTRIGDGLHGTPEYVDESPYYFINGNNLSNGSIKMTSSTRCVSADEFQKHKIALDESTLLLSINGTIGNVALYRGESIILGKSAAYINCRTALLRNYLFYFLQSGAVENFFRLEVTGTTIFNLSLESIRNLPIAIPPLAEQLKISSFLGLRTAKFNELIEIVNLEISLLREYRTRLIADVVTGKLDLREAAANLPEETDETEVLDDELAEDEEITEENLGSEPEE